MLHRARCAAPLRAAFAAVSLVLVAASPAAAIGETPAPPWPGATKNIVQVAEGNQNLEPQVTDELDLLAQGYGVLPEQLYQYDGPMLKFRMAQGQEAGKDSHVVTLLDFTGDARPDVLVDTQTKTTYAGPETAPNIGIAYVYDVSRTAGIDRCATVPPRADALFSVNSQGYGDTPSRRNNATLVQLAQLKTATGLPFDAGALDNPPRILSLAADQPTVAGPASGPARDTLPAAAAEPSTSCATGQFAYDFSKATYRYVDGSAPAAEVTHTDPADNAGGYADLRRVSVQQHDAVDDFFDAVAARGQSLPRPAHLTELTLDFADADNVESDTWVFGQTWNRSTVPSRPTGQIRTTASNGRVKVTFYKGLTGAALGQGDRKLCLPTLPSVPAGNTRSFTVPLQVLPNGDRRVTIPIEELVPTGGADFRFHTISDPGQLDGLGPIDHTPLFAGYALDGTGLAAGCDAGGGNPGASVYLDRSFTVGAALPTVELNASTTTPTRGEPVIFDLGQTAAGDRRCSFLRAFTPTECAAPNLTQTYQQDATAYLALDTAAGPWDQDQVDIKIRNLRPTAAISRVGSTPAQGTDGSYAIVQGATASIPLQVVGTDTDPGTAFTYRWTLDGAAGSVSTSSTYTPSFTAPGTHVVRAWVKDDSGDADSDESVAAVLTIDVVRSPQGAVEIVRPTRVSTGQPFDIEAQTASGTSGYQALTWQWDLDGDATVDFDPARTTRQLTGVVIPDASPAHLVRVRATDAGGRTADATISLNVRRVNEAAPIARFVATPAAPASGTAVTFDGSTSELSFPDGTLQGPVGQSPGGVRFRWNFGDGTPEVVTTTATTAHTYAGSGRPKASLVLEDVRGTPSTSSDPAERTIAVSPGATDANAPVAKLVRQDPAPAEPVFANRPVTLTAAASTAAAGHAPLTFAFDLDGNGSFEKASGAEPTVTFTPTTAGPLTVGVRVTDDLTSVAATSIALDVNADPVAKPTALLAGPAEVVLNGVTVDAAYDATGSKGNNLDPAVTYRWDLDNDGTFETPTGADPKVTATFGSSGEKKVKVRVADRYGNTADAETSTVVRSAADLAAGCTGKQSFREVSYENVRLRGCVLSIKRASAGPLYVISGNTIAFNGMRLRETTGARPTPRPFADCGAEACKELEGSFNGATAPWAVALDTSDGTLRSNAATALRAAGVKIDLPLLSGALNVSLPSLATDGFTLGTPPNAELGGFPLAGGATLKFPAAGETSITVIVGLPAIVGGVTGQATLRVTAAGGLVLDDLRITVGEIALGKLSIGGLSFLYNNQEELWRGGGALTLPSPKPLTIAAEVAIQRNQFKSIRAEVSGINKLIAQGIFLQAIRAGVSVDPLDLSAGITVSAGPVVKDKKILSLDGDMRLKFPSPKENYYLFALSGKLKLADFQLATAFAQFSSNGFFEMGGGIDARVSIGYAKAYIKGWMSGDAFNIDGDASVGVTLGGSNYDLFGGHITLSTTGFGACGGIPVIGLEGGFGKRWDGGFDAFWGCDLSPYRATRPADAPASLAIRAGQKAPRTDTLRGRLLLAGPEGHELRIPAGQKKAQLSVVGTGAAPRVSIVDAQGKVLLSTPADGSDVLTKEMLVQADNEHKTTTVLWKAPPAGKVWVVAQGGSSRVSKVDLALPAPRRTLGVTVAGSGRARTLKWDIKPALQPGERVSLAEEGAGAGTEIVGTEKSRGTARFTPQGGTAGKRSINATITADGLPGPATLAATYVAPAPPAPAKPASVQLVRSSSGVMARWTPGTGGGVAAAKWRLLVRVAHTQRKQLIVLGGTKRQVRIADVNPGDAVAVTLTGSDASGVEGPSRAALVKAGLRASSGPDALASTALPRDVVVKRLGGGKLRVTWKTGPAYVRGWSVRVSGAAKGKRKGSVTLLRTAGDDHSVDFAKVPSGELRVSVIGRRYQGSVTRKDVVYLGGTPRVR